MSSNDELIFDTVAYQNSANTVANYKEQYDAVNATPYQYKSDAERMQALLGRRAIAQRYQPNLYTRFYRITATSPAVPSTSGPGSSGWGAEIGTPGNYPIDFNNSVPGVPSYTYTGLVAKGYIYSPVNTTIQFRTVSDDGILVIFNTQTVIENWTYHSSATDTSSTYTLPVGYTPIQILFFNGGGDYVCNLKYNIGGQGFNNNPGVLFNDATSRQV